MEKKDFIAGEENDILTRKRAEETPTQTRTRAAEIGEKFSEEGGISGPLIQLELEVLSDMVNLETVRNMVRRTCHEAKITDLDEKWVWQMELALNEAAVNIIKHAYHLRKDGWIKIESEVFLDKLVFYLHHWGEDFKRDAIPPPLFDGKQESGYGLFIIESCTDEAIYSSDEKGRKSICLIKNRNESNAI